MQRLERPLLLATAALCLGAACTSPQPRLSIPQRSPATEATLRQSPFANAQWLHQPLATVAGNLVPLRAVASVDGESRFASAINYAEETGSFALLIWHQGQLQLEKYFPGFDKNLRSESASMHKSVMALVVAAAVERGMIDNVDIPASRFIHEWRDDGRKDITLRHLLTMSSGLKPLSSEGGLNSPAVQFFLDGPAARKTLLGRPLFRPPGTHFSYSNADSQTIGLILERASGRPYQSLLSEFLWKPIGADDAYVWLNEAEGFPRTFTALLARPRDWLRIGLLIKDDGVFLNRQVVDRSLVEAMVSPSSTQSGYGWQIWRGENRVPNRYYNNERAGLNVAQSESFMIDDWIFLDGIGGQRVYISRFQDLVIVRLGQLDRNWDDAQLPNRVIRALQGADNRTH